MKPTRQEIEDFDADLYRMWRRARDLDDGTAGTPAEAFGAIQGALRTCRSRLERWRHPEDIKEKPGNYE